MQRFIDSRWSINYLPDISKTVRSYHARRKELVAICRKAESREKSSEHFAEQKRSDLALETKREAERLWKKSQQILLKNTIAGLKHTLLTMLIL